MIWWEREAASRYSPPLATTNTPRMPSRGESPFTQSTDTATIRDATWEVKRSDLSPVTDMAGFVQSLKGLNAAQLMEKKEAIERDTKEFSEVLQTVSQRFPMSGAK